MHRPTPAAHALGEAFQAMLAFRMRSRATQHRLAAGEPPGAETSIDKMTMASAEQACSTAEASSPG